MGALALATLSCVGDGVGPGRLRIANGIAFRPDFAGPLAQVVGGAGSVVSFERVRVVLRRGDDGVALDTTVVFPPDRQSVPLALKVPLSADAPEGGETLSLFLRYVNSAGDTVFSGGPVSVVAVPTPPGGAPPQPVTVPVRYTGPGADAVGLAIGPDTLTVVAGDRFSFEATARDGQGAPLTGTPILWTSLAPALATLDAPGAGTGVTAAGRGTARVVATLVTGAAADTAVLVVRPRPQALVLVSGGGQTGAPGAALPVPVRVRLRATDGAGIGAAPITVLVEGGGAVAPSAPITDDSGTVQLTWTLGAGAGVQRLRLSAADVPDLEVTATADAPTQTAVALALLERALDSQVSGAPFPLLIAEVRDAQGARVDGFSGTVSLELAAGPSGGTLSGTLQVPVVGGAATFSNWTATVAGSYRVRVVATGLAPDTTAPFVVGPGAPASISVVSGDAQNALVGAIPADTIVLRVTDAAGNPVPDAQVQAAVTAGGGVVSGAVRVTDAAGAVRIADWRLGATPGANALTVSVVGGATPAVVTATALEPPPNIVLSVFGSTVVGVERAGTLVVRLLRAAPAGGLVVTVTSDSTRFLTVAEPGTVAFAPGETERTIAVAGLALGTAVVRAEAPGYTSAVLNVPVSLNLISLPPTLTVPFASSVSLPITLSSNAPTGGVAIAVTSLQPGIAAPALDTVVIPAGARTASVALQGLDIGQTIVRATNPNYALNETVVTVSASVDITATSYAINESFGLPATIRLLGGASAVAAPAGGVVVRLSTDDPACAAVPDSVVIPEGITSATVQVQYGGSAVTPCSTRFRATGPEGYGTDSATVSVAVTPLVDVPATMTLGAGLQRSTSVSLGATNHGGTTVRIASLDTTKVLVSATASAVGTAFVDLPIAIGGASSSFVVHAIEGQLVDSAYVGATAPGFRRDSLLVRIFQPVYEISGLAATATTLSADDPFIVRFGTPTSATGGLSTLDALRAGSAPRSIRIAVDSGGIGTLVTSSGTTDSVTLAVPALQNGTPNTVAGGGVAFRPLAQGTAIVRAEMAGFRASASAVSSSVTVTAPSIAGLTSLNVGSGLQRAGTVSLSQASTDTVAVELTFDRRDAAILAPNTTTAGSDTLVLRVPPGSTSATFVVQALDGRLADTLTLTARAAGYTSRTTVVRVFQAVYEILGLSATGTTIAADDPFQVRIGTPTSPTGGLSTVDGRRAGADPLRVTVVNDSSRVGTLVRTAGTTDSTEFEIAPSANVTPVNVGSGGVAYRYLAEGVGRVRANIPGLRALPSAEGTTITVTQPSISALTTMNLGSGLQRAGTVSISQPTTEPTTIRLHFDRPGIARIATSPTAAGTDTAEVVIAAGITAVNYYVQALEGRIADTLTLVASAPGFLGRTSTVRIFQPVLDIISLANSMTALDIDDPFQVRIATPASPTGDVSTIDPLRVGSPGLTVRLTSSVPTVGQLATSTARRDTVTVFIGAGQSTSAATVATGGVAFDPLTTGSTVITATSDATRPAASASVAVSVVAPAITFNTGTPVVGAGLQGSLSASLNTTAHGGVTVVIRSSNPAVLRLAPTTTTVATDSIVLNVAAGIATVPFVIAGVEGASGAVTITARATGFVDATASRTVEQPVVTVQTNLAASGTAGVTADDPFTVQVGLANATRTDISLSQAVRAGAALPVTIASSVPTVGTLITTNAPAGAGQVTIAIPAGSATSATTVAGGGVAFRFLGAGTTNVTASAPNVGTVTASTRTVTVNP